MATRFDVAGDQLVRTTDLPDYNGVYSVAGCFRLTSDTNAVGCAWAISNDTGTEYDFLGVTSDGTGLVVDGGASGVNVQTLTVGTWYYIGMVRASDTSLTGYAYDWTTLNSGTDTVNVSARGTLTQMAIGSILGTYLWNGRCAYLKCWNRALSSAEFVKEANTIRPQDTTSLYGWWPVFPGASERLVDYSGNGRNWTAGGTLTDEQEPPVSWGSSVIIHPYAAAAAAVTYPGWYSNRGGWF